MTKRTCQHEETDLSLKKTLDDMDAARLSALALNMSAIAWIGMNLSFSRALIPTYSPGCFIEPNPLNLISVVLLFFGCYLAILSIRKGSLLNSLLAFTFLWSLISTLAREAFG